MRNFKIAVCIVLVALLFSSCNDSQRINELTIVQGFGIDIAEDKTKIYLQYLNLFQSSGSTEELAGNITDISNGEGNSISKAILDTSKSLSNEIFFGQNKIVIFGKEYAQKNVTKGIDYLLRSDDSRPDVIVAMSETSAKDIIESKEKGAKIPAENVFNLLKLGEKKGLGSIVTVNNLINLYNDETSDIYMPILKKEEENVSCSGTAIFSKEKYAASLNEEETFGFLFVEDKIDGGVIVVKTPELGQVGLEITSSKTNKKAKIDNGNITLESNIKVSLIINEVEKGADIALNEKDIKEIENKVENQITEMCKKAVRKCFASKSDPFMTARYVYLKDKSLYNSLKPGWREKLPELNISVNVDATLKRVNDNSN